MRKELIYGILIGLGLFMILGFKDTNNQYVKGYTSNTVYNIPLKQKDVIVTSNTKQMKLFLKKGYVCEDVDIDPIYRDEIHYTLVKY